ncbi:MAG: PEGA domain-containing protein, partial [Candidatus Eisenbacteria bacterium]
PPASAPGDSVATAPPPASAPAPAEPAAALAEPEPAATPVRAPYYSVPPQRPAWPSVQQLARPVAPLWRRPWAWALAVVALFVGGWLVGAAQDAGHSRDASGRGALGGALHALGLGGPRFVVNVNSRPPGAWISVDGKTLTLRTPAVVELTPGEHTIGLSFSDLGGATYTVRGLKGDRVPLDATLWGALEVFSPNAVGIVSVSVDGEVRGFAPLRLDSLIPGVHEVRFSGPGMASWGQTVDIRVGETKELLARATPSPASGVLQVQASLTDEQGSQPLKGGQVWIDGEPRGTAPLTLDLPRGPHSVRLVYKGQQAPIQVLDLPGGNQRFAVFEFGMDLEVPQLIADVPPRIPRDRPAVVSASLPGVGAGEVREMWLHTLTADGPWRRYPMTLLKASGGAVGVVVFPPNAFDDQGRARYYLSAQYGHGDESFTEIRTVQLEKSAGR